MQSFVIRVVVNTLALWVVSAIFPSLIYFQAGSAARPRCPNRPSRYNTQRRISLQPVPRPFRGCDRGRRERGQMR